MKLTISDIRYIARITRHPFCGFLVYQLIRGYNGIARGKLLLTRTISPGSFHPSASIHPSAVLSNREVRIFPEVTIGEGVIIRRRTTIGTGSRIEKNCVIGETGFQVFKWRKQGILMVHTGSVSIGDRVTIGEGTCIDRALFGKITDIQSDTRVGANVKIGHNITIGRGGHIDNDVAIGGNSIIGDRVFIGSGVSIANRIFIAPGSSIPAGRIVTRDIRTEESS